VFAAHFTDYRIQRNDYQVLAKLPDTVSFALVTHEDELLFDLDELVLKRVATLVSPSVGALRLTEFFEDPFRQPLIIYARDSNDAAQMVSDKKAFAAIIPTALVNRYEGLNTVTTTAALPHMALSASSHIPQDIRDKIKQALLQAKDIPSGQAMLNKINFAAFVQADARAYQGFDGMLKNVLGY